MLPVFPHDNNVLKWQGRMDRLEANLDLEERNARVNSYNLHGSQGDHSKIQHDQGGIRSTTQKEEEGLETQQDCQPVFVDGIPGFPWPQESTLQQTMRLANNKGPSILEENSEIQYHPSFLEEKSGIRYNPSYLEENSRIRYNPSILEKNRGIHYSPPPLVDPCSNHLEQSTNHKDHLKQGPQVLGNVSRFFQDFQAETSLLAQRQVELEVDGVGAEVERDFLEREPVIREVSRERSRVGRVSRRVPREEFQEFQEKIYRGVPREEFQEFQGKSSSRVPREELLLSASKLNSYASQNCSK